MNDTELKTLNSALKELEGRYVKALDESERIRVKSAAPGATLGAEDLASWQKWMDEVDTLRDQIELSRRQVKARQWANATADVLSLAGKPGAGEDGEDAAMKAMRVNGWKAFFRTVPRGKAEQDGLKALAAQEGDLGGFLVLPQDLMNQLIVVVKDLLFVRQYARVVPLDKAESLGVPVLDNDLADPTWTAEISMGNENTTAPFSKRELAPHPLAQYIKISNKFLRVALIDPEAEVMDRLAYKQARVQENGFLNGTGANQPLGVFTASSNGIDTSRDTTTANAGAFNGDDLILMKHNLKPQYWAKARWTLHRSVLAQLRILKDSVSGQYVWQPGIGGFVAEGTALVSPNPDTILGQPYNVSELAPSITANTGITSGKYLMTLGDWSFYMIADALQVQIQRFIELAGLSNQTIFTIRSESDGMPVLAEAFQRLKVQ